MTVYYYCAPQCSANLSTVSERRWKPQPPQSRAEQKQQSRWHAFDVATLTRVMV